jgi:hypothetical protein
MKARVSLSLWSILSLATILKLLVPSLSNLTYWIIGHRCVHWVRALGNTWGVTGTLHPELPAPVAFPACRASSSVELASRRCPIRARTRLWSCLSSLPTLCCRFDCRRCCMPRCVLAGVSSIVLLHSPCRLCQLRPSRRLLHPGTLRLCLTKSPNVSSRHYFRRIGLSCHHVDVITCLRIAVDRQPCYRRVRSNSASTCSPSITAAILEV